jgi:hypothetical protein
VKSERFETAAAARAAAHAGMLADKTATKQAQSTHFGDPGAFAAAAQHYETAHGLYLRAGALKPASDSIREAARLQSAAHSLSLSHNAFRPDEKSQQYERGLAEMHSRAADSHIAAARARRFMGQSEDHHQAQAQGHSILAMRGGAWNEDDHPRDENGRFV